MLFSLPYLIDITYSNQVKSGKGNCLHDVSKILNVFLAMHELMPTAESTYLVCEAVWLTTGLTGLYSAAVQR